MAYCLIEYKVHLHGNCTWLSIGTTLSLPFICDGILQMSELILNVELKT